MLPIKRVSEQFKLTDSAMSINAFKSIIKEAGSKEKALPHFLYLWYKHDFKSPFRDFEEVDRHQNAMVEAYGKPVKLKAVVKDAENMYISLRNSNPAIKSYYTAKMVLEKAQLFLSEQIDLEERTDSGAKVYSVIDLQKGQMQLPQMISTLNELRKAAFDSVVDEDEDLDAVPTGRYEE